MNSYSWLVRRELWEHRAVWIAPAICGAILVLATLVGGLQFGELRVGNLADPEVAAKIQALGPDAMARLAGLLLVAIAVPFYVTVQFTQFFYALDALSSDRRDRSVLFWKSLPVSDSRTVLSKLAVAVLVIPLVALACALVAQVVLYAMVGAKLSGTGLAFTQHLWTASTWGPALLATLYGTLAVVLWSVPLVGWLLLVSALAPRSPFLWAVLPPLALALLEEVLFDTNRVMSLLAERTLGMFSAAFAGAERDGMVVTIGREGELPPRLDATMQPVEFLTSPELLGGLVVGAALIAAAVWARRYRDDNG